MRTPKHFRHRVPRSAALVLSLAFALAGRARANDMLHASAGAVVDATGAPVALRCVNLSPWLEPEPYLIGKSLRGLTRSPSEIKQRLADLVGPDEARDFWRRWQAAFITEADFARLNRQGFDCVRLPLNAKFITTSAPDGSVALDESAMLPVDRAVAWGAAHGIYVILDLHAAFGGQNPAATVADVPSDDTAPRLWHGPDAAANQQRTVALWRALAARYANARSVGGYDLLNEPQLPGATPKTALPKLYDAISAAIRSVDPNHLLILEGDRYAHDFDSLPLPTDSNVMYEFHEYSLLNPAWREPDSKALAPFLQLRASTSVPLWLGEFGEETLEWQAQMVQLMETNRIGWAVWPWKRIDLGNNHPAVESIALPDVWEDLFKYLVGAWFAGKPSREKAEQGMSQMLEAIRTENCTEDRALLRALTGR